MGAGAGAQAGGEPQCPPPDGAHEALPVLGTPQAAMMIKTCVYRDCLPTIALLTGETERPPLSLLVRSGSMLANAHGMKEFLQADHAALDRPSSPPSPAYSPSSYRNANGQSQTTTMEHEVRAKLASLWASTAAASGVAFDERSLLLSHHPPDATITISFHALVFPQARRILESACGVDAALAAREPQLRAFFHCHDKSKVYMSRSLILKYKTVAKMNTVLQEMYGCDLDDPLKKDTRETCKKKGAGKREKASPTSFLHSSRSSSSGGAGPASSSRDLSATHQHQHPKTRFARQQARVQSKLSSSGDSSRRRGDGRRRSTTTSTTGSEERGRVINPLLPALATATSITTEKRAAGASTTTTAVDEKMCSADSWVKRMTGPADSPECTIISTPSPLDRRTATIYDATLDNRTRHRGQCVASRDREEAVRKMHTEFEHAWTVARNDRDMDGDALLAQAAFQGNIEQCRALLEAGADIEAINDYGCTALHAACEGGSMDTVVLLVAEFDANVNAASRFNAQYTPYRVAAMQEDSKMATFLGSKMDCPHDYVKGGFMHYGCARCGVKKVHHTGKNECPPGGE